MIQPSSAVPSSGTASVPAFDALYLAIVASVSDPMSQNRVQLKIPQVFGTAVSNWAAPISQPPNTILPVVGAMVVACFAGGDRNNPLYAPLSWAQSSSITFTTGTFANLTATDMTISGTNGGLFVYSPLGSTVSTFTTSGTWVAPAGVTAVVVECWGAGGGGSNNATGGAGGGAGEYAKDTITVVPGNSYGYVVGAAGTVNTAGGNSTFNTTSVVAHGGQPGSGTTGGLAGSGSSNGTHHSGGNGANSSSSVSTATFTSSGSWTAPAGVTSVQVECWGAGGGAAGGGLAGGANSGGYGGGAGAYSRLNAYTVIPGNVYSFTIGTGGNGGAANNLGTNGGDTSFVNTSTCLAKGGRASTGSAAAGGAASSGVGDVRYSGGNGGTATGTGGSGGGGAAGSTGNGSNGQSVTGSTGGTGGAGNDGGGTGGHGGNGNAAGSTGNSPGAGGGGGGGGSSAGSGGNGATGQVILTFTLYQAGGGGSSGGTSAAGNNGALEAGGAAVTGGGPGGGTLVSTTWTATPASGPGGGGGGFDSYGAAGTGAAGQVRITYGTASLIFSVANIAMNDPVTSVAVPEGPYILGNLPVSFLGVTGENTHGTVSSPAARQLQLAAPTTAGTDVQSVLILNSAATGSPPIASINSVAQLSNLSVTPSVSASGTSSIYSYANRPYFATPGGTVFGIDGSVSDSTVRGPFSLNNDLTIAWNLPAFDWNVNTAYRLTAWGHGTQAGTATTVRFNIDINGTGSGLVAQAGPSGTGFAAGGAAFNWKAEALIQCVTTGVSGTINAYLSVQVFSGTTGTALVGEQTGVALNTSVVNTYQIRGTMGASASITGDGSLLERLGP